MFLGYCKLTHEDPGDLSCPGFERREAEDITEHGRVEDLDTDVSVLEESICELGEYFATE
jgi:hypothetical protein